MPKKTRKQKLIAQLRRKERLIQELIEKKTAPPARQIKSSAQKKITIRTAKDSSSLNYQPDKTQYDWVISDLKRIIILSLLAFSLEAVVYWAVIINNHSF